MEHVTIKDRGTVRADRSWITYMVAGLLGIIGLALAIPGTSLIRLGGSPYYLLAGLVLLGTALLLLRGRPLATWIYAAFLAATLVWSLYEVGWNGWALVPRLLVFLVVGLLFFLPGVRRPASTAALSVLGAVLAAGLLLIGGGIARAGAIDRTAGLAIASPRNVVSAADREWLYYGKDQGGSRFSSLDQIDPANVGKLRLAWSFRVNGGNPPFDSVEATPLKVGDSLYLCSATNDIVALDAETGRERWRFNAKVDTTQAPHKACRGVAYYVAPSIPAGQPCKARLLTATIDARLLAVDAATGRPCQDFGSGGAVNLLVGMGEVIKGYYFVTSPPQIVRGKAVLGGWVADGQSTQEPSGVIRAFDAVTGQFAWAWDVGRPGFHGQPPAGQQFTRGTPNSWAPMSADEALGLVYLPTGNAPPDYFGGLRTKPDGAYSSSVVALDAQTGAPRWSFQTTHHDIWDYDVGSQPTLFDLPVNGKLIPALVQPTKRGELFILDRRTGKPLRQVTERAVPASDVPGERASPTQPFSTGFPSFPGELPTERTMWGISPFDQLWCRIRFREARFQGTMTPLTVDRSTIVYPGYLGGIDWGGVSVDPVRKLMFVVSSNVPMADWLITRKQADQLGLHPFGTKPVRNGVSVGGAVPQAGTPYAAMIHPFLSPLQIPCVQPPYSTAAAVDLTSNRTLWHRPFGTTRASGPLGIPMGIPLPMGTPSLGGSVMTGSGLTFIAANADGYFRAFETATGRELWRYSLPAGGQATPMTYWSDGSGRQFIVIAAGGHRGLQTKLGDYLLAFALPRRDDPPRRAGT